MDDYQIEKYEVTNRQYAQCVKAGICGGRPYFAEDRALHPVVNVTWEDGVTYCKWIGGRLPTEAEWEKAASWNDKTKTKYVYPWGNDPPTADLVNYNGSVGDTTPVGKYETGASPCGLYDMAGNVWEWVNDWYDPSYYATLGMNARNPQDPDSGQNRVLRGSSGHDIDSYIRSASRLGSYPAFAYNNIGFRCSRSLP